MDALVIHSIRDANHCFKNELYKERKLFTTHPSVEVYLKERYGLECHCILADFSIEALDQIKIQALNLSEQLICQFEKIVDTWLSQLIGKQTSYFRSLYIEKLPGHVASLLLLKKWLVNNLNHCDKWLFYAHDLNGFIQTNQDLYYWLKKFFPGGNLLIIDYPGRYAISNDYNHTYVSGFTLEEILFQYKQNKNRNLKFHYIAKLENWPVKACNSSMLLNHICEDMKQGFSFDYNDIISREFGQNQAQSIEQKDFREKANETNGFLVIKSMFESIDGISGYKLMQEQLESIGKFLVKRKKRRIKLPQNIDFERSCILTKIKKMDCIIDSIKI